MPKRWKNQDLYSKKYRQYLPWSKALWITKKNDVLQIKGEDYTVTNVELLPIKGSIPKITVIKNELT